MSVFRFLGSASVSNSTEIGVRCCSRFPGHVKPKHHINRIYKGSLTFPHVCSPLQGIWPFARVSPTAQSGSHSNLVGPQRTQLYSYLPSSNPYARDMQHSRSPSTCTAAAPNPTNGGGGRRCSAWSVVMGIAEQILCVAARGWGAAHRLGSASTKRRQWVASDLVVRRAAAKASEQWARCDCKASQGASWPGSNTQAWWRVGPAAADGDDQHTWCAG